LSNFTLHGGPERFDQVIVAAIADGSQPADQPGVFDAFGDRPSGELRAVVTVNHG